MLASNYRMCVWKANGELDCTGLKESIPCRSLVPVTQQTGSGRYRYNKHGKRPQRTQQEGGSDPARFYPSLESGMCCSQPSGPMIATSGFGRNALWVSPEYHQPPRDYNPPQNYYYTPDSSYETAYETSYQSPYQAAYAQSGGQPTTYSDSSDQGSNRHKQGKGFVQTKLSKNFYAPRQYGGSEYNGYNNAISTESCFCAPLSCEYLNTHNQSFQEQPQVHSNGIVASQEAPIPDGVFPEWKPDLRYRVNLEDVNAQTLYKNMLSGYNAKPLYDQTDMNYTYNMNQEYRDQAQAVGCYGGQEAQGGQYGGSDATFDSVSRPQSYGFNPLPYPSQMHWDTQGKGVDMAGYTPLDSNPNINLDSTLNTGNEIAEAFQSPLLTRTGGPNNRWSTSTSAMSGMNQMNATGVTWGQYNNNQTGYDYNNYSGGGYGNGYSTGHDSGYSSNYGSDPANGYDNSYGGGYGENTNNGGVSSYGMLLQADQAYLQPSGQLSYLQSGVSSPMVSGSNMSPAPVQLQATSPWMYYETPYQYQNPAPKEINWIPKVRSKLRVLSRELGSPYLIDRKSGGFAMWNESSLKRYYAGIFKRVELHDESVPCEKPYPHNRNLYTWVRLDVPVEELDKLQVISPNIYYDMGKKWLCVSGATLKGNFALLTLVCMYLQKKLSCYQIERYELQKKYLLALVPKSGLYHASAQRTYIKTIKESLPKNIRQRQK